MFPKKNSHYEWFLVNSYWNYCNVC